MDSVKVIVGDKEYICQVAKTEEDRKLGLMNVKYLPPDRGVLFVWNSEGTREMWMKNTKIPLDQISINEDDEVVEVYPAKPEDESLIPFRRAKYILEVNLGSGIQPGDDFEIDDEDDLNKYTMKVLAPDGSTLFRLLGGERIVSRKETRTLIKKAKRAKSFEKNPESEQYINACKSLGKYIFKVLHGQDHRDAEYVLLPDSKKR